MLPGNYSLGSSPNDLDEVRSKGVLRIAALASRLTGTDKPDPAVFRERVAQISKNYMLTEDDVNEVLSDATMAFKRGKSAYDYLKEGKPSFSVKTGRWMKYINGITPEEYESAFREIHLSDKSQRELLDNPDLNKEYTEEQRKAVINKGKRPNNSEKDLATGLGVVF